MKFVTLFLFTLLLGAPISFGYAHHAYAGVFDMKSVIQIEGRVVRLELLNPHTRLYLEVTSADGKLEEWVMQGPGKLSLARRGWTDELFEEGERITVYGNPSLQGKKAVWLDRVVLADGRELVDPLVADRLAIEEARRARILKAQEQKIPQE